MEQTTIEQLPRASSDLRIGAWQVLDTIHFEIQRNVKKFVAVCVFVGAIFALFICGMEYSYSKGMPLPPTSLDFLSTGYSISTFNISALNISALLLIGSITDLIYLFSILFGGSSIVPDFEKQTGHLLFPKISRGRLFVGRLVALYLMEALVILLYYLLVGIYTAAKYSGSIPIELGYSLFWALLFAFATLAFVFLLSALMKRVSTTLILGVLALFILFGLADFILSLFTKMEPLFILTYYGNIISSIFAMPNQQTFDQQAQAGIWTTPSVETALIGLIVYAATCLILAFLAFRQRELTN